MSEELRKCPFCGEHHKTNRIAAVIDYDIEGKPVLGEYKDFVSLELHHRNSVISVDDWQNRPLEDALQAERDLLRQQLEVAMKNLIIIKSGGEITYWSEMFQATVHNDIPKDIAGKALAEIAKLGEKK